MTSRLAQRRRKRLAYLAGGVVFCFFLIFLFFWWLFNASFLAITSVDVSGENVIPASSIQTAVQSDISGSYLGLFSKGSVLIYPKHAIERDLLALYPTLMSVDVHAEDFHTISVSVVERTPFALWCGADTTVTNDACALLDQNGLAYANAPSYSGEVYQTYFGTLPDGPLPKQFLTSAEFHSLSALATAFSGKVGTDTLQTIYIDPNNDVHLAFSGGYEILFGLHDDSGQVFQRFSLALTADPFTTHPLSDFEYIDLRFGDKVYYKLANQ